MSREAHAQWQRDRCQEIWAAFVAELDLLAAKEQATSNESEVADLLKAYAMVELMSPPVVLEKASRARDKAMDVDLMLFTLRMQARDAEQLEQAKQRLRTDVAQGSGIAETRGLLAELVPGPDGEDTVDSPGSREEYEDMRERFERYSAAHDALEALAAVEQAQGDQATGVRALQALLTAAFGDMQASSLVFTAQLDRDEQQQVLAADKTRLNRLRDVFLEEARKELDALGG